MSSKPMLMFLDTILHACCIDGTHVNESGLKVSTEVLPDETILFFHIDSNLGRTNLNIKEPGSKICDYLVFYSKDSSSKETVCFLELKGKKAEDAIKQIINTYMHVASISKKEMDNDQLKNILWKACICMHGQAPRSKPSNIDQLIKHFGQGNIHIKHGIKHFKLLGLFLRDKTP